MKIEPVQRYVLRNETVIPFKTLEKASEEAAEYKFSRISKNHYACEHGDAVHILIEKDGAIGCSCAAMTFAHDNDVCKHIASFLKRSSPPTELPSAEILAALKEAGWTGLSLIPPETTSDPDGNDNEGDDPVPDGAPKPEPPAPELGEKVWRRECPHCGKLFEGTDLDEVKRKHQKHIEACKKNPVTVSKTETVEPEQMEVNYDIEEESKMVTEQVQTQTQKKDKNMRETTTEPQTAVQTTEPQRGFLTAAVSLSDAIAAFELYGQAKTRLLNDSDVLYIGAGGKPVHKEVEGATPYIKKSGWRKMARFFGLSVDILGKEKIWTEDAKGNKYYIWAYQIKVSHQCGAYVLAEGVCSSRDKFFTKGGKVTADETNIMLKAQTVGINRGISDLLGAGEVSAEEVE